MNLNLSYSTVEKWTNEFKFVWESLNNRHSGKSIYATTPEIIAKVHSTLGSKMS